MLLFDSCVIDISSVASKTLFYHCNVSLSGKDNNCLFISSEVSLTEETFISLQDYSFYYSKVSDLVCYRNVLVPANTLLISAIEDLGTSVYFDDTCYSVNRVDSGNALKFDKRYSVLENMFLPFMSVNGPEWSTGIDISDNTFLDFSFIYDFPDIRDLDLSTGTHVGVFSPSQLNKTILLPNSITKYISGLFPVDLFVPEDVIKISGILDNYTTSDIMALFPRNDLELRNFLRAVATSLGLVNNNIQMLSQFIQLMRTASLSPKSYLMDLNKHFTFRVGPSLFQYNPATLELSFSSQFLDIPFFFYDAQHRFNISRMISIDPVTLVAEKSFLIYFDLDAEEIKSVEVVSLKASMPQLFTLQESGKVLPFIALSIDATRAVSEILFFQTALFSALSTPVAKDNNLLRSYATKSRSSNLLTNFDETSSVVLLLRDIVEQCLSRDTRIFILLQNSASERIIIEELS